MGNIHSVYKKLNRICSPVVSSNPNEIISADKIILPGVGHFAKAMNNIVSLGILEALSESVLIKKKPILGICLGMQLFANSSEEGNVAGLGWIDADVIRFKIDNQLKYKIPHVGWNTINIKKQNPLMLDIDEKHEFYFVHSYHFKCNNEIDILNTSNYECDFTSAIAKDNIFGVQYHPEKSQDAGDLVLKNFIRL
jgi:imidazole glycerol-phosphate synthase subunit HisH